MTPGLLTLALNAVEGRLMLALGSIGQEGLPELCFAQEWQAQGQGAELLMPALAHAVKDLGLSSAQLGRIAVVTGPGSFTGLRLGVITAAALARALNLSQAPLPYLPLLAAAASRCFFGAGFSGPLCFWALTHARRDLVHMQGFIETPEKRLEEASPLQAISLEECAARLRALSLEGTHFLLGSGWRRNQDFFAATLKDCPTLRPLPPNFDHPSPAFLLYAALELPDQAYSRQDLTPIYARPSEAEENLPQIAARLGLDPKAAAERLKNLQGK